MFSCFLKFTHYMVIIMMDLFILSFPTCTNYADAGLNTLLLMRSVIKVWKHSSNEMHQWKLFVAWNACICCRHLASGFDMSSHKDLPCTREASYQGKTGGQFLVKKHSLTWWKCWLNIMSKKGCCINVIRPFTLSWLEFSVYLEMANSVYVNWNSKQKRGAWLIASYALYPLEI
jgi:hypothetical protein